MVGLDLVDENRLLRKRVAEFEAENNQLREKAEKWDRLVAEDPDASIILGDELDEACMELDTCRQKLEAILKVFTDQPSQVILWSPNKKQYSWNYPFTAKGEEMLSKILEEVLSVEC